MQMEEIDGKFLREEQRQKKRFKCRMMNGKVWRQVIECVVVWEYEWLGGGEEKKDNITHITGFWFCS